MTFAVLPFQAPADDKTGAQVATAMTEAAFAVQERKVRVGAGGVARAASNRPCRGTPRPRTWPPTSTCTF